MSTAASRARRIQGALGLCLAAAACLAGAQDRADGDMVATGRRIYEEGVLASGALLAGRHANGVAVSGAQAACVRCHRRSGMGGVEGDIQALPITGNALFGGSGKVLATMDPRSGKLFNFTHEPYTDASLARALREGASDVRHGLNGLMPRYALADADMKALIAYLRQLSVDWSPGARAHEIRFATVIAPGIAPDLRRAFVETVEKAVQQKNGSTVVAARGGNRRHMAGAAEFVLGTERKWMIDVWELQGSPDSWSAQIDAFNRRAPVFALVSGLGRGDWEPVSAFCERSRVPCWFPSIDAAPEAPAEYAMYFSRGVALEAEALAEYLKTSGDARPRRIAQIYREGGTGASAARAFEKALAGTASVDDRPLNGDAAALRRALHDLGPHDAAVLWLRSSDLGALGDIAPPVGVQVFVSARMSGEGRSLPPAWKESAAMIYPYELPAKRQANLAYFRAWLAQRNIPLVDEAVQSEAYFALAFLTDTVTEMLDNLYRDYLLERAENMISRREGARAEEEMRTASQARILRVARAGAAVGNSAIQQAGNHAGREGTSAYPRLSLAPGQRFASKGAYIVRFDDDGKLAAVSDWLSPPTAGGNSPPSHGRR